MQSPQDLNELPDETLRVFVRAVIDDLRDPSSSPQAVKVAPFVTAEVLLRLHNIVCEARHTGDDCAGWPKQATLARVVGCFTGVKVSRSDAEFIGNAQDCYLRTYTQKLKKAIDAERKAASRAAKQGKELAATHRARVLELQQTLYRCSFGGVPRHVVARTAGEPVNQQPVPVRRIEHVDEMNVHLQQKIVELQQETGRDREMQLNLSALCAAVEQERAARVSAEAAAAAAAAAEEDAASKAALRVQQLKFELQEANRASSDANGRVVWLGAKLGAAHVEVSRALEREEKMRAEVEKVEAAVVRVGEEGELRVAARVKELKELKQKHQQAEGQVERLQSQLGAAHVDAGRAVEREQRLRKEAEEAASEAAAAQAEALAKATSELQAAKEDSKGRKEECNNLQGRMERLGSQLGAALIEAARATECARKADSTIEQLRECLKEQEEQAAAEIAHIRDLKAKMAERARDAEKRAGSADNLASDLEQTRKRLREVRKELNCTRVQLNMEAEIPGSDIYSEDEDESSDEDSGSSDDNEAAVALKRVRSMPTWRAVRGKGAGKGEAKLEWGTRLIIYSLLAMMVPPSAVGRVIVAIVKRTASWLKPTAPTCETVKRCRFELRFVEEALAARRIASAYRIRSIGFDETTKFGNASLTSNVQIEPTKDASLQDVILRAAYCPLGGTAELQVKSIEVKCFGRLRRFLQRWQETFERMCPAEKWTGPHPSSCSLHRLGGGGAIMSDTCTTARKAKSLLTELVAGQVQEHLGPETWGSMSDEERQTAVRTHQVDCWQHLRNIFLAEMSKAQAAHVQTELKDELETFSAWERMSTDFSQLLRACFKEFHHSCRYYKGQGRSYFVWLQDTYPAQFSIHLERADGGRQDLDYDAAVPLFVNRKYFIEFLHERVFLKKHSNILEDFLYVTFSAVQYVAMARANAIVDLLISRPLRWLSGKSSQLPGWSPFSMGDALDLVEQFFVKAQHDGSLFLDPALDIFKPIAEKQPLFAEWRRFTFEEDSILAPDGKTKHLIWKLTRDELLTPQDATNVSTREKTIEYLEVQCVAGLRKMHDPKLALRDKLSSMNGANSVGNTLQAHLDTLGCHATNDALAESVFGTYDMILRRCPGVSMEAASGVAQAVRSMMLSHGDQVAHRKEACVKKQEDFVGWFYSLPEKEQEALVELARISVKEMRDIDRQDHRTLDEYHKARRKTNEEEELDALFTEYALALSFFERWCKRGVQTVGEITSTLSGYGDRTQDKLNWLREQIEMRTIGLSWTDWKTPWSSKDDEAIGSVEQLKSHLKAVLTEELSLNTRGLLPSRSRASQSAELLQEECPAPQMKRKTFKALGTPTVQTRALSNDKTEITPAQLVAAAQRRREELERAGEIDWVCDRQLYPTGQGPAPNKELVGKMLEVRWRYRHKTTGEPVYMWCEGEVVQAADGETDRVTARCKKVLPAGALRIKWPADVEYDEEESYTWTMLNPKAFNRDVHLGWRYAASELKRMEKAEKETNKEKRRRTRH